MIPTAESAVTLGLEVAVRTGPARATMVVISLFSAGVLGGAWAGSQAAERARDPYAPVDTLVRVMGLIETTYVDEVSTETLVAAAVDGMLDQLDPHSSWMAPHAYRDLQRETHGSYTGIGVEVKMTRDGAVVTRVLPGSPAHRDGLTVGDTILAVDGQPLESADLDDISTALLGPRGAPASLHVRRDGSEDPVVLETVRDEVRAPAIEALRIDDDHAYLRILQFQEGTATETAAALRRWLDDGALKGVILDLRDNPGGLLREAVGVADLFLSEGTLVSTWGRLESERHTHEATPEAIPDHVVVTVLVNGRSASAAEIVAGALQDTGRAMLVGARTYGKGSVQTLFEHRDGSALKLTIGRYYTPSGEPVAPKDGRQPDLVVPWDHGPDPAVALRDRLAALPLDDEDARQELLALVDALPPVKTQHHDDIPWTDPFEARLEADPQLSAALVHTRGRTAAP